MQRYEIREQKKFEDISYLVLLLFMCLIAVLSALVVILDGSQDISFSYIKRDLQLIKAQPTVWEQKQSAAKKIQKISKLPYNEALERAIVVVDTASIYALDPDIVLSIFATENPAFDPSLVNATRDHGIGQVNEQWVPRLLYDGIIKEKNDLLTIEGGIKASCYILSILSKDKPLLQAVSDYHSRTPALACVYKKKVLNNLSRITGDRYI